MTDEALNEIQMKAVKAHAEIEYSDVIRMSALTAVLIAQQIKDQRAQHKEQMDLLQK